MEAYNSLVDILKDANLKSIVVPSVMKHKSKFKHCSNEIVYLLLSMDDNDIKTEAEIQKYPMEIDGSYLKLEYLKELDEKFKPFRDLNKQEILINLLHRVIDIKLFQSIGIISKIIYLHNQDYYNK